MSAAAFAEQFDPFGLQEESDTVLNTTNDSAEISLFDPFGIEATAIPNNQRTTSINTNSDPTVISDYSPLGPPALSRVTQQKQQQKQVLNTANSATANSATANNTASVLALPPKLTVKLTINEEVSSYAIPSMDGASEVNSEGSISAQIQCSDATKNAPFALQITDDTNKNTIQLRPNSEFVVTERRKKQSLLSSPSRKRQQQKQNDSSYIVTIPKHELGFVPIGTYTYSGVVDHMPILLERKISCKENTCRISIQVRSKLTNTSNMENFTIVVSIPEILNDDTIQIIRGKGTYDSMHRTITWQMPALRKGHSIMVAAQGNVWNNDDAANDTTLQFPVLLRCISVSDHICPIQFTIQSASGHPSSVTQLITTKFRLLHRLQ